MSESEDPKEMPSFEVKNGSKPVSTMSKAELEALNAKLFPYSKELLNVIAAMQRVEKIRYPQSLQRVEKITQAIISVQRNVQRDAQKRERELKELEKAWNVYLDEPTKEKLKDVEALWMKAFGGILLTDWRKMDSEAIDRVIKHVLWVARLPVKTWALYYFYGRGCKEYDTGQKEKAFREISQRHGFDKDVFKRAWNTIGANSQYNPLRNPENHKNAVRLLEIEGKLDVNTKDLIDRFLKKNKK